MASLKRKGGSVVDLGDIHLGSDDLRFDYRRTYGGITLQKMGVPLGSKEWFNGRSWVAQFRSISEAKVKTLLDCWEDGICLLLPNDDTSIQYKVMITEAFEPTYIAPDKYDLTLTMRETP